MFGWLARLRRRPQNEHEPEVEQSQREQLRKFEEWGNVMHEVDRVQTIARGKPRRSRRVPH